MYFPLWTVRHPAAYTAPFRLWQPSFNFVYSDTGSIHGSLDTYDLSGYLLDLDANQTASNITLDYLRVRPRSTLALSTWPRSPLTPPPPLRRTTTGSAGKHGWWR